MQSFSNAQLPTFPTRSDEPTRSTIPTSAVATSSLRNFLDRLNKTNGDADAGVSLVRELRITEKRQHAFDADLRDGVSMFWAIIKQAKENDNLAELVKKMKAADPTIKTNDSYLAVNRFLFENGPHGRQYDARNKGAVKFLEAKNVDPAESAEFIRKEGGVVSCYAKYRDMNRVNQPRKSPRVSLSNEIVEQLGTSAEVGVALIVMGEGKKKQPVLSNLSPVYAANACVY
jgi:hypothetical protein